MKTIQFTINDVIVNTKLNDNAELGYQQLLEDTKGMIKDPKSKKTYDKEIVEMIMALPRDPASTVSQYKVLLQNVIVNGVPSKTNLVKLAASLIPDKELKAAVSNSHHKSLSSTKPDSKDSQEFKEAQAEWAQAMQEIDYTKYPKLTAFMEVEDPKVTALNALMALGFTKEQAEAAIKVKASKK